MFYSVVPAMQLQLELYYVALEGPTWGFAGRANYVVKHCQQWNCQHSSTLTLFNSIQTDMSAYISPEH